MRGGNPRLVEDDANSSNSEVNKSVMRIWRLVRWLVGGLLTFSFSGSDGTGRLIIGCDMISDSKRLNEAFVFEQPCFSRYS